MDAPPIRYVRTRDSFDIAYSDTGKGVPVVWMPYVWTNQQTQWQTRYGPVLRSIASEYRLITYDGRGQGCSTRGLPDTFSLYDCESDLEAVVDALKLERFFVFSHYFYGHIALRYAARNPERVAGLMLRDTSVDYASSAHFIQLAEADWDSLVGMLALLWFPGEHIDTGRNEILKATSRDDWMRLCRAACTSRLEEEDVALPILLMSSTNHIEHTDRSARTIASSIPGSRVVTYPTVNALWSGQSGDPPPDWLTATRDFLHELSPPAPVNEAPPAGLQLLTAREQEILRLIAGGRSTREISKELVLSERTVGRHITNLYGKLGIRSRSEATAFAIRNGLS